MMNSEVSTSCARSWSGNQSDKLEGSYYYVPGVVVQSPCCGLTNSDSFKPNVLGFHGSVNPSASYVFWPPSPVPESSPTPRKRKHSEEEGLLQACKRFKALMGDTEGCNFVGETVMTEEELPGEERRREGGEGGGDDAVDPSHFERLQTLGEGTFGEVYMVRKILGQDRDTMYAMKVMKKATLTDRDRKQLKIERGILTHVRHPFLMNLHYAFQEEGRFSLVLDLVEGGDLYSHLSNENGILDEEDTRFYLTELALALGHLHQLGIIYRDLKPENILLDADGHIRLTDFGLCKHTSGQEKTYSFCGTVAYMAPEVINRTGYTTAADWWSFGVLMFDMLVGRLPFEAENNRLRMTMITRAKLRLPSRLSEVSQALLRALLKRNSDQRLGTGPNGIEDVKGHVFFAGTEWEKVYRKEVPPPYRPGPLYDQSQFVSSSSPGSSNRFLDVQLFKEFEYVASRELDDLINAGANKENLSPERNRVDKLG